MAFNPEQTIAPVAIRDIGVDLFDNEINKEARYRVQVEYSNGDLVERSGNLLPHLTAQQKAWLVEFMAGLRVKAELEMLPQEGG